ncbi:MAG: TM2 domain-containing protein [Arcanobacterium sp.]|nr:TM2 domain-containing protein [Arcanobacterium sp.]
MTENYYGQGGQQQMPPFQAQNQQETNPFRAESASFNANYQQSPNYQQPYAGPPQSPYGYHGQRSKIVAGVLGILVGALGIHNFYLGQNGKGLAQLLISVLSFGLLSPISGLWGFIEGVLILVSTPGTKWHHDAQGWELRD